MGKKKKASNYEARDSEVVRQREVIRRLEIALAKSESSNCATSQMVSLPE